MRDDENKFTLGPARVNVDRDLDAVVVQGEAQASSGRGRRVLRYEPADLFNGVSTGSGNYAVTVQLDDGSYAGSAVNATGRRIYEGYRVAVGIIETGDYAVIGVSDPPGTKGGPAFSGGGKPVPDTIGGSMMLVDYRNRYGLGDGTIVTRAAYTIDSTLPPLTAAGITTTGRVGGPYSILSDREWGMWYDTFDGYLYALQRSGSGTSSTVRLRRFDPDTNSWSTVTNGGSHRGVPALHEDGLYFCNADGDVIYKISAGSTTPVAVKNLTYDIPRPGYGGMIRSNGSQAIDNGGVYNPLVWLWEPGHVTWYNTVNGGSSRSPYDARIAYTWDYMSYQDGSGQPLLGGATVQANRGQYLAGLVDYGQLGGPNLLVIDSYFNTWEFTLATEFDDALFGLEWGSDNETLYIYGAEYDSFYNRFDAAIWRADIEYGMGFASLTKVWSRDADDYGETALFVTSLVRTPLEDQGFTWAVMSPDPLGHREYLYEEDL